MIWQAANPVLTQSLPGPRPVRHALARSSLGPRSVRSLSKLVTRNSARYDLAAGAGTLHHRHRRHPSFRIMRVGFPGPKAIEQTADAVGLPEGGTLGCLGGNGLVRREKNWPEEERQRPPSLTTT